jgi:hypothetical protein
MAHDCGLLGFDNLFATKYEYTGIFNFLQEISHVEDTAILNSGLRAGKCTASQVPLLRRLMRTDVEVEDIHRQAHSRARVWYIYYSGHVALHWRAGQQQVDLVVIVSW